MSCSCDEVIGIWLDCCNCGEEGGGGGDSPAISFCKVFKLKGANNYSERLEEAGVLDELKAVLLEDGSVTATIEYGGITPPSIKEFEDLSGNYIPWYRRQASEISMVRLQLGLNLQAVKKNLQKEVSIKVGYLESSMKYIPQLDGHDVGEDGFLYKIQDDNGTHEYLIESYNFPEFSSLEFWVVPMRVWEFQDDGESNHALDPLTRTDEFRYLIFLARINGNEFDPFWLQAERIIHAEEFPSIDIQGFKDMEIYFNGGIYMNGDPRLREMFRYIANYYSEFESNFTCNAILSVAQPH